MKAKYLSLLAIVVLVAVSGFAQSRVTAPDLVVKSLYTAHDAKRSPFFQKKSRARVDQYFTKRFGGLIWKDAVGTKPGEIGSLDFDPLYNAQDVSIKRFKVGKPMYGEGNLDVADVAVTFMNYKTAETVLYRLERGSDKKWLIDDISYPSSGFSLSDLYTNADDSSVTSVSGRLNLDKSQSHIMYVGRETGDYAAYCFANDSEAGRAILEKCKNGDNCSVWAEVSEGTCKPKGFEGTLSASGSIVKVKSVRSYGKLK